MLTHLRAESKKPSRVVILGATGFVGGYFTEALKKEHIPFLPLTSKDVDLASPNSFNQLNNLLQPEDSLVFLSCLTPDKGKDVETLFKNLEMARNVGKVLFQKKIDHCIYISSDAVYGTSHNPIDAETLTITPDNYAYMHIGRELILKEACAKLQIPLCVLRPVGMVGKGDTHNSYGPNRFYKMVKEQKKIVLFGAGEEKRDHLAVTDFVKIMNLSLMKKSQGTLNVATGKSISFYEVAKLLKLSFEKNSINIPIEHLPAGGPVTHKHFDIVDLIKAFPGFSFTKLEDTITEMVNQ